ncbi:hypothetical protein EW145_g2735, partial [Phellinidium pouzarii]
MNSYPAELLVQLAPVMFVAGLEPPRQAPSGSEGTAGSIPTSVKRTNSSDQFALLSHRLREMLNAQRKPVIWAPESIRKGKIFQVVLVDKIHQFPPRKIPDPASSQPPHSPLSPLTPSSPLYPDGLVAPIWIRKHTSLVPSIFVLFLHLFEHAGPIFIPRSPLEPDGPDVQKEKEEREKEERRRDTELAREIADRKKGTNERGMKLTVVLMASRRMLDDPTLDSRLTFIRRSSGLDSRAALFVLSPVTPAELADFVKSLQQALFEPAIEYYTAHSKRVRRKRNRHGQATSAPGATYAHGIANVPSRPLPLRPEGWTVRYEYKMACFAEFRGEDEVALKHYQDAYTTLMIMFGSPAILQPRTKRWAEAKVLADCINIKICKLFLYNSEHALALSQHNIHIRRFCDLSMRAWGIGEDTFEYWSWLARQHRVFAELLEQGTHFSLTIPTHLPVPTSTSAPSQQQQEIETLRALGVNPSTALMHPGFYYYVAAECTERRRLRFLAALDATLYTKSYELFKKYSTAPATAHNQMQGRFTLWIAYRIAQTYYESGKFEMAVRFFERIARTYSREKWESVLYPLFSTWYACAQQLGDVEMSIRLLIEMIARGHGTAALQGEDESAADDLHAILKSTVPSSSNPIVVDLTESEPLLNASVVFWTHEIKLGEQVAFQISISLPADVVLSELPISELRIYCSDGSTPIIVKHVASESEKGHTVCRVDVGHISLSAAGAGSRQADANLQWRQPDATLVLAGTVSSDIPQELKFTRAELCISQGDWNIELPFNLGRRQDAASVSCPRWLSSTQPVRFIPIRRSNASSVIIKHRPHQVHVAFSHHSPAYLDESYPISVDVTNNDDKELDLSLDVLLQPGDDDSEEQQSAGLIKGISFGTVYPGTTACKTLRLMSTGSAGERVLDVSVQSRTLGLASSETSFSATVPMDMDMSEVLETLVIPVIAPFTVTHATTYARRTSAGALGGRAFVTTTIEADAAGIDNVEIRDIKFVAEDNMEVKLVHCSLDEDDFPLELMPGDQFSIKCELSLAPAEDFFVDKDAVIARPGLYVLDWRRMLFSSGDAGASQLLTTTTTTTTTTHASLPTLKPPTDGLIALL